MGWSQHDQNKPLFVPTTPEQKAEQDRLLEIPDFLKRTGSANTEPASVQGQRTREYVMPKNRKKKLTREEKKLRNFQWQKADEEMGLTSIDPKLFLGARELWVFNTKYNTCAVYVGADKGGLQVHRSAVKNYDPDLSYGINLGKKADVVHEIIKASSDDSMKILLEAGRKPIKLTGQINNNTILLKLFQKKGK
jgi:hypothetical protein